MLNIGTTVASRYIIEAVVGHGGMGTIYRAQDTRLGRTVALKVLRPDLAADRTACAHFLREGQIAAQMVHANVVRTYDAGEDEAGPFLVQELLSGRTLDQVMPLPPQRAASILSDVAAALTYIHNRGYIHCDVKPQNILLKNDGTPVLLDFGIARAEGTAATTLIATPHYLAPERARGGPPTVAADLYALGIILFQSIEGHPPFDAPSIHAIIQQHIDLPVPPVSAADSIAPVLNRVIARLTAKQPDDRYTSAETVREDLAAIARSAGHAFPTLAVPPVIPASQSSVASLPGPSVEHLQHAAMTWSNMPTWRKRRWIAFIVGTVLLLSLAYVIARGNRAEAQRVPDTEPPAIAETQPALLETPPAILETQPDNEQVIPPDPTTGQSPAQESTPPTPEAPVPAVDAPADQPINSEPDEPADQPINSEPAEPADQSGNNEDKEEEKEEKENEKERDKEEKEKEKEKGKDKD